MHPASNRDNWGSVVGGQDDDNDDEVDRTEKLSN